MKKLVRSILILCLTLTLSALLTACSHKCEFSAEWVKDATSHWHACSDKSCAEIADKAEHTWNEGEITTKATQEAEGVKTFTCTVCAQTKTEAVVFTGLSEADWNAAFESSVFENFAYSEVSTTTGSGMSVNTEALYKFTQDNAWVKMTIAEQTQESYAPDAASAEEVRKQFVDSIKEMTPYESYAYDAETKTYKATANIHIASLNASMSDATLTFADGKLAEMKYSVSFTQNGISFSATSTVSLSDYGAVVLTPPAQ